MGFAYTYTHAHDEPSDMTNQPQQYFSFINWPEEKEPVTWKTHISHRDLRQNRAETSQSDPEYTCSVPKQMETDRILVVII